MNGHLFINKVIQWTILTGQGNTIIIKWLNNYSNWIDFCF